ncbi:DUF3368 domain-containing protein [Candidatus Halobeggiatoa sp. HSG11]|nr:DUF3368 domain-containing protein [Candidatus Halobeggiatoa sp. HSG11]
MKAVSNSSILIALSRIGQLDLLSQKFKKGIIIPQAVWHEVVETGAGRSGANEVKTANWITVHKITNKSLFSLLYTDLDKGESEAITLAIEQQADIILLDERSARKKATNLNLTVLGTIGILIWAKQVGLVENLKIQLDTLQTDGKFRFSQTIYKKALKYVGE